MSRSQQPRLPLVFKDSRQFEPVQYVSEGAKQYAESQGLSYNPKGLEYTRADSVRGTAVGYTFKKNLKEEPSESTLRSYEAMRKEVLQQYEHMTKPISEGGMGITVQVTEHDPYSNPEEMASDLRNRQIKVLSTQSTGGHSVFSNEENDMFRAVHDVFGHAGIGRDFGRHGEEAAYLSHSQMFSPEARPALASETRGQNSYLNYVTGGEFPDNYPVNMPSWAVDTGKFKGVPEEKTAERERRRKNRQMYGTQLKFDF